VSFILDLEGPIDDIWPLIEAGDIIDRLTLDFDFAGREGGEAQIGIRVDMEDYHVVEVYIDWAEDISILMAKLKEKLQAKVVEHSRTTEQARKALERYADFHKRTRFLIPSPLEELAMCAEEEEEEESE